MKRETEPNDIKVTKKLYTRWLIHARRKNNKKKASAQRKRGERKASEKANNLEIHIAELYLLVHSTHTDTDCIRKNLYLFAKIMFVWSLCVTEAICKD